MKKSLLRTALCVMLTVCIVLGMTACGGKSSDNTVVIYSSMEDYRNEYLRKRLDEEFPDLNIVIEYMTTGNHAAKLFAEGTETEADISIDMEYGYLNKLSGVYATLEGYDYSIYCDDIVDETHKLIPVYRNGGAIIINRAMLDSLGLAVPESYADLIKPEYKGLISMPNPKSSGTGYMFLRNLVNVMGEDEAFAYFDKLAENLLSFTDSGSGPVNALVQGEVAIGLGMTGNAVVQINQGVDLEILYFEEGSPYTAYGMGIIEGRQDDEAVAAVFKFLVEIWDAEDKQLYFPEQIYKDVLFEIENFPKDIVYANMDNNTGEEKERLLAKWVY